MQFCYLIRTHQEPAQIRRLVGAILRTTRAGWVLLLHDRGGCSLQREHWLQGDTRIVVMTTRVAVRRGEFSALATYLEALAALRSAARGYDWLIHLSGQDYPLRPLHAVEADLERAPWDAFLDFWETQGPANRWQPRQAVDRYHYQYRRLPEWIAPALRALKWTHSLQPFFRVHTTYGANLGIRAGKLPFGPALRLMGGSEWHYLRRGCVDYLLGYCESHPELIAHYRRTVAPDESLVPTVLCNAPRLRVCPDNRRYIDWRGCVDGRPRVLTLADLPALSGGKYDFARKFDARVDARILDALDERLSAVVP